VSARLLNAMYFHVPQSRQRMIFIGVREDLDVEPSHPVAMSHPVTLRDIYPRVESIRSYGAGYEIRWLNSDRSHPTLQADPTQKPTRWLIDAVEHRPSTEELSAVASFPALYSWVGSADESWRRIGNSVPPLFMRAIAEHIRAAILTRTPALHAEAADMAITRWKQ
jgi:DNA (cytosine-5)-methyltransferase 1